MKHFYVLLKKKKISNQNLFELFFSFDVKNEKMYSYEKEILSMKAYFYHKYSTKLCTNENFYSKLNESAFHQYFYGLNPNLNSLNGNSFDFAKFPNVFLKNEENKLEFVKDHEALEIISFSYFLRNSESLSVDNNVHFEKLFYLIVKYLVWDYEDACISFGYYNHEISEIEFFSNDSFAPEFAKFF